MSLYDTVFFISSASWEVMAFSILKLFHKLWAKLSLNISRLGCVSRGKPFHFVASSFHRLQYTDYVHVSVYTKLTGS